LLASSGAIVICAGGGIPVTRSLKSERTADKTYRTRDAARADVFDYIERFYNPRRRHSTLGYLSPVAYEERMRFAQLSVRRTGGS